MDYNSRSSALEGKIIGCLALPAPDYHSIKSFISASSSSKNAITSVKSATNMAENPNLLWPTDSEGLNIADFDKSALSLPEDEEGAQIAQNPDGFESITLMHSALKDFWEKKETNFRATWSLMTQNTRRNMIRVVAPTLPESRSNPTFTMSGETHSVHGAVIAIPAPLSNIHDLIQGDALPDKLSTILTNPLFELLREFLHHMRVNAKGYMKFDPTAVSGHYSGKGTKFHVFDDEIKTFDMKELPTGTKDVKEFEEKEMAIMLSEHIACRDFEFKILCNLVNSSMLTLATIVDEYRVKVEKKTSNCKLLSSIFLCLQCKESGELKKCSRCHIAKYCSATCKLVYFFFTLVLPLAKVRRLNLTTFILFYHIRLQGQKTHWKVHKKTCRSRDLS